MDEVIGTQERLGLRQGDGCPGTVAAPKFHRLRRRRLLLIASVGRFSIKICAAMSLDLWSHHQPYKTNYFARLRWNYFSTIFRTLHWNSNFQAIIFHRSKIPLILRYFPTRICTYAYFPMKRLFISLRNREEDKANHSKRSWGGTRPRGYGTKEQRRKMKKKDKKKKNYGKSYDSDGGGGGGKKEDEDAHINTYATQTKTHKGPRSRKIRSCGMQIRAY